MKVLRGLLSASLLVVGANVADAHEPPGVTYFVFGFPNHAIPVMDGDTSDWDMVPEAFWVTREFDFEETVIGNDTEVNLADFNTKNITGWNSDANKLYTMADVVDDFFKRDKEDPSGVDWDDGFDFIVDADHSGGDLWNGDWHAEEHDDQIDLVFTSGQNYRYYTPPLDGYYIFMLGRGFVGNDNFVTTGREIVLPEHLEVGWSMTGTTTGDPNARVYEMKVTPWGTMYRGDDGNREARSSTWKLARSFISRTCTKISTPPSKVSATRVRMTSRRCTTPGATPPCMPISSCWVLTTHCSQRQWKPIRGAGSNPTSS